jgi:hypothetical protein
MEGKRFKAACSTGTTSELTTVHVTIITLKNLEGAITTQTFTIQQLRAHIFMIQQ